MSEELKNELFLAETVFMFYDDDSKVPYISFNEGKGLIMFRKNGVRYFLNNETGHVAYNKNSFWQLSRIEFISAKKHILKLLVNCSDEFKKLCLDVLDKLDFNKGRANAYFEIRVNKEDRNKIDLLRFNFRDLCYTLQKNNNVMFKENVNDPWSHLNKKEVKSLEKRLVLYIMNRSKTLKSKISEIEG